MIRVTNLPGAVLNAAGSGLAEARPMDGPSNERRQHTCSLKYDGYIHYKERRRLSLTMRSPSGEKGINRL
ncbi:hypothetical protein DVQ84_13850 [Yersinia enterocolitica]|nr:hypothetical protein [Yersinia enterocolitica]EKN6032394.1 hypothetical protein [Yersinia enterocolitica]EKN6070743.1 hypothetical protein [Yersinia enterocolitica]EKN6186247.1 hypothetical protein [Yersinia enterocolitica]EKN6189920.1 hypothetical protein [Yersinia enterocolitica]